jgi:hypothetical protein
VYFPEYGSYVYFIKFNCDAFGEVFATQPCNTPSLAVSPVKIELSRKKLEYTFITGSTTTGGVFVAVLPLLPPPPPHATRSVATLAIAIFLIRLNMRKPLCDVVFLSLHNLKQ